MSNEKRDESPVDDETVKPQDEAEKSAEQEPALQISVRKLELPVRPRGVLAE
jgi:hypothetical protein